MARPLLINNRVVLHLLEALQVLRIKVPGGGPAEARRLSFRALDIEQIGHVYEGLLDHTAKRASEVILGLAGAKDREPEVPLSNLEELAKKGTDALVEFLAEETGRSEKALRKALDQAATGSDLHPSSFILHALNDPLLAQRVRPFAALLRADDFGQLVVIPAGSVYVTAGSDRRSSGTHYTPRSLTEPIVQHTLEPLVHIGPAEGKPQAEWRLRSPQEILTLKVCDMTMGSGAFLVQTCRYLAERLVEAWELEKMRDEERRTKATTGEAADSTSSFCPPPLTLHGATPSTGEPAELLLPTDPAERIMLARRAIADRCLYGVDINPMAVEMAKLSLWLITVQRDRPFTFLDHALKSGDSLLGVIEVKQIERFSLRPGERQVTFGTVNLFRYVEEASAKRRALKDLSSNDHAQIDTKNRLHAEAEAATGKVKALADVLIAFELRGLDGDAYESQHAIAADHAQAMLRKIANQEQAKGRPLSRPELTAIISSFIPHPSSFPRRPLHWAVEFPEVFARGGFDGFVGNPPFMGGQKITGALGTDYRDYLVQQLAQGRRGSADLCAYFFLRAHALLRAGVGLLGLVATNTIAQGDTREVGLERLLRADTATLVRAVPSRPWPGTAALEVAHVWLHKGAWQGQRWLDDQPVHGISPFLAVPGEARGKPNRLAANADQSFQGSIVLGMGFVLSPGQAQSLIAKDARNREVLFPYLNGDDLNSRADQTPSRWIINFHA